MQKQRWIIFFYIRNIFKILLTTNSSPNIECCRFVKVAEKVLCTCAVFSHNCELNLISVVVYANNFFVRATYCC